MEATTESNAPQLVDVVAAAKRLSVSPKMIRMLEWRGHLKSIRIGRRVLFDVREIARFVATKAAEAAELAA